MGLMRLHLPFLLLGALTGFSMAGANDTSKPIFIRAAEASQRVGDKVLVEGVVADVTVTEKGMLLLNFGAAHPNQVFTAVVRNIGASATEAVMRRRFAGKTLQVTGVITLYQGKPQMVLERWEDCKVASLPIFTN
jgi:DNA/RNA endonuclease YhcR with UshA esterase domain